MSIENSNWATEKDHNGEAKLGNLTNIMAYMLQRAWLNQTLSKFDLIEFKREDKGSEILLTNPNLRLVGHQMKYPISRPKPGSSWHFKRWVRLTRTLENVHTNKDQFFINAYFPGYHFGRERDGKPRKTNVTIEPKLGKSEVGFTAGIVIPDNAPVKEVEMLDTLTSAMESAGFQRLYDCNLKERGNSINSKRVFLLSRQSTSVEKWDHDIARGLKIMASIIAPIWVEPNHDLPDIFAIEEGKKDGLIDKIIRRKYVILEGVPGTGKTHIFKQIKKRPEISTRFLTFHPSSDYSSFIGGIRPGKDNGKLIFNPTKGHLLKILEDAEKGPALLWIDELNRANIPRVFGDLISLIGNSNPPTLQILNAGLDDDKLELTDNQKKNLHIVATMNTSDRSVTPLDAALRRRFSFIRLKPMSKQELIDVNSTFFKLEGHIDCFFELNEILRNSMGEDAVLGHSYLFEMLNDGKVRKQNEILMIWQFSILPNIVDTLMLTQNFGQIGLINKILRKSKIPLCLVNHGNGLGEMILIEVI